MTFIIWGTSTGHDR